MALDTAQRAIQEKLMELGPQSVKELAVSTGYSPTLVRQKLELMRGNIIIDKKRQPYVFDINPNSPDAQLRQHVDKLKNVLLGRDTTDNPVIKMFTGRKRETLPDWIPVLEALSLAIQELEKDGQLIDTLEVR